MTVASTLAVVLALHGPFVSGPSVHVPDPNLKFEIRWIGDFVGDGKVELFADPEGTVALPNGKSTPGSVNSHIVEFAVGGTLMPDTT